MVQQFAHQLYITSELGRNWDLKMDDLLSHYASHMDPYLRTNGPRFSLFDTLDTRGTGSGLTIMPQWFNNVASSLVS